MDSGKQPALSFLLVYVFGASVVYICIWVSTKGFQDNIVFFDELNIHFLQ